MKSSCPPALWLLLGLLPAAAPAADPPPSPPARAAPADDPMTAARSHIAAGNWSRAIEALRRANASGDADWNNLMGYALRKQPRPDLDGAQRHYDAALAIDPRHQGALEYSGELALMKGDLVTAEERLARLAKLCTSPCEALDDLQKAVARYKAGGRI